MLLPRGLVPCRGDQIYEVLLRLSCGLVRIGLNFFDARKRPKPRSMTDLANRFGLNGILEFGS